MNTVWTVWEKVEDYPEMGGGDYLVKIYYKKETAEKYCHELNTGLHDENTAYYIEEWPIF